MAMQALFRANPIFRERQFVPDAELAFVLMPFSEAWSDRVWEIISQAVAACGLRAQRADNRYGPIITEDIWRGIVEARIVLADVTGWNPNVFYELGVAHTVGKDFVLLSQPAARLAFDTQGFRHIIYTDNPDGMRGLAEELPRHIRYYLDRPAPARSPAQTYRRIRGERGKKKGLQAVWHSLAEDWDPELPPPRLLELRSRWGVYKKRAREYTWVLEQEQAKAFIAELRRVWPLNWQGIGEKRGMDREEKVVAVLNDWRVRYAAQLAR